jgi:hypothetical protein
MGTSRRTFFKGLVGGVGALSLGSVILSQRGWFGFVGPAEAAKIREPKYYKLKSVYAFFEGYKIGPDPPDMFSLFKKERALYPEYRQSVKDMPSDKYKPQIIEHGKEGAVKKTHILNDEAAYITRMLVMEVDVDSLASMYASRFQVENPMNIIKMFLDSTEFFEPDKDITVKKQPDTPNKKAQEFDSIWADFSVGSVHMIFQLTKPI